MKSGWFNESKRHSLASKGIKTPQKIQIVDKYVSGKKLSRSESAILGNLHNKAFGKKMCHSESKKEYNVYLEDDGTLDTVVSVNGKDIRFDTEFASQFRNRKGEITKKGWEQLKEEAINAYEDMEVSE